MLKGIRKALKGIRKAFNMCFIWSLKAFRRTTIVFRFVFKTNRSQLLGFESFMAYLSFTWSCARPVRRLSTKFGTNPTCMEPTYRLLASPVEGLWYLSMHRNISCYNYIRLETSNLIWKWWKLNCLSDRAVPVEALIKIRREYYTVLFSSLLSCLSFVHLFHCFLIS